MTFKIFFTILPEEIIRIIFQNYLTTIDIIQCDTAFTNQSMRNGWKRLVKIILGHGYVKRSCIPSHKSSITRLIHGSNGMVITAGTDGSLKVWNNICTSHECKSLIGHMSIIRYIGLLDNGKLISASADRSIRIWEITSGKCLKLIKCGSDIVFTACLLSNEVLLYGTDQGRIKILNIETESKLSLDNFVCSWDMIKWDEERIIMSGIPNSIQIINYHSKQCERILIGHHAPIFVLLLISDHQVASGSEDNEIRIWNLRTGECERVLQGHRQMVYSLCLLSDGRLASGSRDQTIRIWDLSRPKGHECVRMIGDLKETVFSIAEVQGHWDNRNADINREREENRLDEVTRSLLLGVGGNIIPAIPQ